MNDSTRPDSVGSKSLTAGHRARPAAWIFASSATLLSIAPIAYVHHESLRTLVSAHGLLHTAIAQRFASWAVLPGRPENPFFAGEPLPYYWVFHYLAARLASGLEFHPLYAFELLIFLALALLWSIAATLGARLYGRAAAGLLIGLLALAGTNPFGAAILLLKVAARGTGFLEDRGDHFWGLLHPIFGAVRFNDPYGVYGPLFNFFFNISSRPVALSLLLLVVYYLLTALESGARRAWLGVLLASAACTAFSFLIGIVSALALSAGLVVAFVWNARWSPLGFESRNELRRSLIAIAMLSTGVLLAAPTYYYFFFGTHGEAMHLNLRIWALLGIAYSACVLVVLAWLGVSRDHSTSRQFLQALTLAGSVLIAGSAIVELPASNDCNLFHAGAFLLAVPAAGGLLAVIERAARPPAVAWVMILLIFVPTPALVTYAYLHRPPIALAMRGDMLVRIPSQSPLARFYDWARGATESDAVFVLDPRTLDTPGGSIPEMPALTQRCLFTGAPKDYTVAPHADAQLRYDIALRLTAAEAVDPNQDAYLKRLGRPLYLVFTRPLSPGELGSLVERYGMPRFQQDDVAAFKLL